MEKQIFIYNKKMLIMRLNEQILRSIIEEELTKSEVSSLIANKIDDNLSSAAFKKKVKELASDVVSELFKILWQRNSFWKTSVVN